MRALTEESTIEQEPQEKIRRYDEKLSLEEIEQALEQTHDPDARVRAQAVAKLCPCRLKANNDYVWDRLLQMAHDADVKVRGHILHMLADGSPRSREAEVIKAIEGMQHDPDLKLRRRVRKLLAHYNRTGKINIL